MGHQNHHDKAFLRMHLSDPSSVKMGRPTSDKWQDSDREKRVSHLFGVVAYFEKCHRFVFSVENFSKNISNKFLARPFWLWLLWVFFRHWYDPNPLWSSLLLLSCLVLNRNRLAPVGLRIWIPAIKSVIACDWSWNSYEESYDGQIVLYNFGPTEFGMNFDTCWFYNFFVVVFDFRMIVIQHNKNILFMIFKQSHDIWLRSYILLDLKSFPCEQCNELLSVF